MLAAGASPARFRRHLSTLECRPACGRSSRCSLCSKCARGSGVFVLTIGTECARVLSVSSCCCAAIGRRRSAEGSPTHAPTNVELRDPGSNPGQQLLTTNKGNNKAMPTFAHELGSTATDRITGFVGTIVGRSEWTTGCRTYCLSPKLAEDGAYRESQWFYEDRVYTTYPEVKNDPTRKARGGPISRSMPTK